MNQVKIKTGTFTGASAAVNVDLGFIPDYFTWWMNETIAAGNMAKGQWDSGMPDGDAQVSKAIVDNGVATVIDEQFETTNGISKLDTSKQIPDKWKLSTVYVIGDVLRPTINNGYYYVCKTAGTSHTTEPTWLTVVGGDTSEGGGSCVWTCYRQGDIPVRKSKVQGVVVGTGCMTNAKVYRYLAIRANG